MANIVESILVIGSTGNQGRAVVASVIKTSPSTQIHALVRDANSSKAQALHGLSPQTIALFEGTLDDPATLIPAMQSITAVFFLIPPSQGNQTAETTRMQSLLHLLKTHAASLKRIVFTTSAATTDPSSPKSTVIDAPPGSWRYAMLHNKFTNECALRSAAEAQNWKYTILRPGWLLSNWTSPLVRFFYPGLIGPGPDRSIQTALPKDYIFAWTDLGDIGKVAARALLDIDGKAGLAGRTIAIASELSDLEQTLDVLGTVVRERLGKEWEDVEVEYMGEEEAEEKAKREFRVEAELFNARNRVFVDMEIVRGLDVPLGTVKGYFEREAEALGVALGL
jgi:uncharacterized protein YbjT (DUF2867 family)